MAKRNEGKYKPTLTYVSMLEEISKVREYGIAKHGSSEDWRTTKRVNHFDAALRHINAAFEAEFNRDIKGCFDDDSQILHLSHAASNIMFLIEEIKAKSLIETNVDR